jgi:hypothetical protein
MKKGTLATIIGIAMLLGLVLVPTSVRAMDDWIVDGYSDGTYCYCPGGGDCSYHYVNRTALPCDWDQLLSDMRSNPAYAGEDDNNVYLHASAIPGTNAFTPSALGSYMISYSKAALQAWVNAGCPPAH